MSPCTHCKLPSSWPFGNTAWLALSKEWLLFLSVWIVRLKVSQSHRWVLTFCAQSSSLSSLSASQSVLSHSPCWQTGKDGAGAGVRGQGLSRPYYWISVLTFNLLLWGPFPQNRLVRGLHPGSWVTAIHTDSGEWWSVNTWSTSMTNLLSDTLIPLTKHKPFLCLPARPEGIWNQN